MSEAAKKLTETIDAIWYALKTDEARQELQTLLETMGDYPIWAGDIAKKRAKLYGRVL